MTLVNFTSNSNFGMFEIIVIIIVIIVIIIIIIIINPSMDHVDPWPVRWVPASAWPLAISLLEAMQHPNVITWWLCDVAAVGALKRQRLDVFSMPLPSRKWFRDDAIEMWGNVWLVGTRPGVDASCGRTLCPSIFLCFKTMGIGLSLRQAKLFQAESILMHFGCGLQMYKRCH